MITENESIQLHTMKYRNKIMKAKAYQSCPTVAAATSQKVCYVNVYIDLQQYCDVLHHQYTFYVLKLFMTYKNMLKMTVFWDGALTETG